MTKFYLTVDNGEPYGRNRMTGSWNEFVDKEKAEHAKENLAIGFGWDDIEIEEVDDDGTD